MLKPLASILAFLLAACGAGAGTIDEVTASPSQITFTATEPENSSVAGSSVATVHIHTGNASNKAWTLSVKSYSTTTFENCSGVHVSDIRVTCDSITQSQAGSKSCAAPVQLSTSFAQVAGGTQSSESAAEIAVTLSFTFADNWHHPALASGCSLTIQYQAYSAD